MGVQLKKLSQMRSWSLILRTKLILAGLRAILMRLAPDFVPQAFADEVLALLEARNTPARTDHSSRDDREPALAAQEIKLGVRRDG